MSTLSAKNTRLGTDCGDTVLRAPTAAVNKDHTDRPEPLWILSVVESGG